MPTSDFMTIGITLSLYAGLVISPGPGFALISRMALSGRREQAFAAAAGFGVGATAYALLTMGGLAFVIFKIDWLASGIQFVGGLYLVWLGIDAWRQAGPCERLPASQPGLRKAFTTGLLVDLTNPKGIAFFLSLYAVAITAHTALWAKMVILAGGFVLEIGWYSIVAVLLSRERPRMIYQSYSATIDKTVGSVLGLVGGKLAVDQAHAILEASEGGH